MATRRRLGRMRRRNRRTMRGGIHFGKLMAMLLAGNALGETKPQRESRLGFNKEIYGSGDNPDMRLFDEIMMSIPKTLYDTNIPLIFEEELMKSNIESILKSSNSESKKYIQGLINLLKRAFSGITLDQLIDSDKASNYQDFLDKVEFWREDNNNHLGAELLMVKEKNSELLKEKEQRELQDSVLSTKKTKSWW